MKRFGYDDVPELEKRMRPLLKHSAKHIGLAFAYVQSDPEGSLNKSRIVLENILHRALEDILGHPLQGRTELDELAKKHAHHQSMNRVLLAKLSFLQELGNVGSHGRHPVKPREQKAAAATSYVSTRIH